MTNFENKKLNRLKKEKTTDRICGFDIVKLCQRFSTLTK